MFLPDMLSSKTYRYIQDDHLACGSEQLNGSQTDENVTPLSPDAFRQVGEICFGPRWGATMADYIDRSKRHVGFLCQGDRPVTPEIRAKLRILIAELRVDLANAQRLARAENWSRETFCAISELAWGRKWRSIVAVLIGERQRVVWDIARGDAPLYEDIVRSVKRVLKDRPDELDRAESLLS